MIRRLVIIGVILSANLLSLSCSERASPSKDGQDKTQKEASKSPSEKRFPKDEPEEDTLQAVQPLSLDSAEMEALYTDSVAMLDSLGFQPGDTVYEIEDQELELVWLDDYDQEPLDPADSEQELAENKLIRSEWVKVHQPLFRDEHDSVLIVIEERLSINPDPVPDRVALERWRSPVNYKGYKWNRRKLILFGLPAHSDIHLYYYLGNYFFSHANSIFLMEEHLEFRPFETFSDSVLTNFLLDYGNGL